MAISTDERSDLIKLVVGMFNASPGAEYLSALITAYEAHGRDLGQLARTLATNPIFVAVAPPTQSAAEFADFFLTPLGLQNDPIALNFINSRFNAGVNKGQIIREALQALENTRLEDYRDAQEILNNKTVVAEYHSVDKAMSSNDLENL
ncbi:MAG: hypothetical protein V4603_03065, partial [Pseudomonadota bacterium]